MKISAPVSPVVPAARENIRPDDWSAPQSTPTERAASLVVATRRPAPVRGASAAGSRRAGAWRPQGRAPASRQTMSARHARRARRTVRLTTPVPRHVASSPDGSEVPVPPPSAFHCASSSRATLGDDPSADGEIGALQTEDEEAGRNGEQAPQQRRRAGIDDQRFQTEQDDVRRTLRRRRCRRRPAGRRRPGPP